MEEELDNALSALADTAKRNPDVDALQAARSLLTSVGFARQIDAVVWRSHNQPSQVSEIENLLLGLKFAFRDLRVVRAERHHQSNVLLVGGGSTLIGGAILAAAVQVVFPPFALVAVASGGYAAWRGVLESRRLVLEVSTLDDIVEALETCISRLRAKS